MQWGYHHLFRSYDRNPSNIANIRLHFCLRTHIKVAKVRAENQNAKHKLAQNGEVCTDNVKRLENKVLDVANRDKMKQKIPKRGFLANLSSG